VPNEPSATVLGRRLQCGRREPQATPRCHDQPDVIVSRQDARGGDPQVVLELLQQLKCPMDVSRRRVCRVTGHRAENLGQIALFDKALPHVGWGNLPCDRATGTLPTALCPCRRSSSAAPSVSCASVRWKPRGACGSTNGPCVAGWPATRGFRSLLPSSCTRGCGRARAAAEPEHRRLMDPSRRSRGAGGWRGPAGPRSGRSTGCRS
jgi:hypothetical protein